MMVVMFESLGRSKRQFQVTFDLGSEEENRMEAVRHAWKMNARIVSSAQGKRCKIT
jgi:hypothetical protein